MLITKEEIIQKLKEIKPFLQQKYNLTEIALFGSYARDEQTEKSDIDIMVDYNPKTYKGFLYSIDEIEKLFPDKEIQAVIKGGIKPQYFEVLKPDLIYA
jgi:predicted nucleotidyltransferase